MIEASTIETSPGVLVWWACLSAVAIANVVAWRWSARRFAAGRGNDPRYEPPGRSRLLTLSGIYAVVCAFRSIMPRADVQRICLVDSWFSTVFVGRTVATIAEVSFVMQWAILLREYGEEAKTPVAIALSRVLVPLICFAETCSWYAVITTNYLGNSMEESTWAVTASLMTIGMLALWPRAEGATRRFLGAAIVVTAGYVAFMATVDVPMYLTRWRADEAAGRAYFTLGSGMHDLLTRWVPTRSMTAWREEIPWMSLYFSIAVWISLYFPHAPRWSASSARR